MEEYSILEQVKIRLEQFHIENDDGEDKVVFDHKEENPLLNQLIKQAENELIGKRVYPKEYTEEQIRDDLKKFNDVIVNLVVYDHSQAGESFMDSFTENGVSRNWKDRNELFVGVYPFVNFLQKNVRYHLVAGGIQKVVEGSMLKQGDME